MKRSRASLMLFMATLVFALHIVRPASAPRAATADMTPLTRLCTADWSPLVDCHADAPRPTTVLAANNVVVANSTALDACHPEALPCSYQSHADYVHGVDCLGSPTATHCSYEYEDAPPIEEFVYGDPMARSVESVAAQPVTHDRDNCAADYDMCADDFDCGIVVAPKIYREDITAITSHKAHSAGLQTAVEINAKNDGIGEQSLATIREAVSPAIGSNASTAAVDAADEDYVGCDYDAGSEAGCRYRDCDYGDYDNSYCEHDYGCHGDAEADVSGLDVAAMGEDLCGSGHCSAQSAASMKVVTSSEEPLDLPPAESVDELNAADYGDDDYEYGDDYDYQYEDDYSAESSSTGDDLYSSEDDYGYGHNDEDLYVYDGNVGEPADLPPAEQIVDDLPPGEQLTDDLPAGEQLTDDLPPGETLPSQDVAYDPYDVECYGDYADTRPAAPKAWIEPGCDEQESFCGKGCYPSDAVGADSAAELTDDQRSWGVGREYPAPPAFGNTAESQEVLRSTARLLNNLGEALLKLSRSLGELAGNDTDDQPEIALPAESLYPWPATLGRHQEIDAPLGL